jgi:molecular chaperone GrpE
MPDQNHGHKPSPESEEFVDQQAAAAAGMTPETGAGEGAGEAGAGVAELTSALEQARIELGAAQDQALRARAEADNVRKRAQREIENAHRYALEKFAAELLPVLDSMERAIESCHSQSDSGAAAAIAEGVELSLKMFLDVLGKAGIQQIDPVGEPFDPQRHEAMSMVESAVSEPGTVVQVLQKGYLLHDRLVRAAMVLVAKAPADAGDKNAT